VFKFQHDGLTRALEGALGRPGCRYSSVCSFVKISLVRLTKGACVQSAGADRTRNASQDQFLDYKCGSRWRQRCRWETSALSRFVGSSLASRCLPVPFYLWYRNQSTRARGKLNSRWKCRSWLFRDPLAAVRAARKCRSAIAKVLPFPAPTDCKSADECVPRDNWFEGSAGHARS
jgi:hypothetical protein